MSFWSDYEQLIVISCTLLAFFAILVVIMRIERQRNKRRLRALGQPPEYDNPPRYKTPPLGSSFFASQWPVRTIIELQPVEPASLGGRPVEVDGAADGGGADGGGMGGPRASQ